MGARNDEVWVATTPKRFGASVAAPIGSLRSVGSALDVLECFAIDGELGVTDIARRVGCAKSTAHRLLQTLCSRGFVEHVPSSGHYRLGLHLYELGHLAQARNSFRHAALPHMQAISRATGHTINYAVADGPDVVFIERIETGSGQEILDHVGLRMPLHCTSSGKVLAAFNPEVDQARREAGFPPRARRTVRNVSDWDAALAQVRRKGFAISQDESVDDVSTIAVPVMRRGHAVGALSAFGLTAAIVQDLDRLHRLLAQASQRIAADLDAASRPTR